MTNAEARFNNSFRPRKPEGSSGRTAQDVHLDSHTAPEPAGLQLLSRAVYFMSVSGMKDSTIATINLLSLTQTANYSATTHDVQLTWQTVYAMNCVQSASQYFVSGLASQSTASDKGLKSVFNMTLNPASITPSWGAPVPPLGTGSNHTPRMQAPITPSRRAPITPSRRAPITPLGCRL